MNEHTMKRTSDLSIFTFASSNRGLDLPRVERIAESIRERNLLHLAPIVVTDDYVILDGQHRLEAARTLQEEGKEISIFYLVDCGDPDDTMRRMNENTKNWRAIEYVDHYADGGSTPHQQFLKRYEKYSKWIRYTALCCAYNATPGRRRGRSGRNGLSAPDSGEFSAKLRDGSDRFSRQNDETTQEIVEIAKATGLGKVNARFVRSYKRVRECEGFDYTRYIELAKSHPAQFEKLLLGTKQNQRACDLAFLDAHNFNRRIRISMPIE